MRYNVVVVGGGPAGLAAALEAEKKGVSVLVVERDVELGGILPQCIHQGFGLFVFGEMWTGPEYAQHYVDRVESSKHIDVLLDTMVLEVGPRRVVVTNKIDGVVEIEAGAVVLAMGCRERTRSQILIPGSRPAGVFTAGTTQRLINVDGIMPGSRVVVVGSGDVGLIMARRFLLEGADVLGVFEIMSYPGGLGRNIVQCLDDFEIPLHLSETVVEIHGKNRVEAVSVAKVDPVSWKPDMSSVRRIDCDVVVLAVGLIPENELSRDCGLLLDEVTGGPIVDEKMSCSVPGVFACGNVVHVHDVVDDVTVASIVAGSCAADFVLEGRHEELSERCVVAGNNVSYVVPQRLSEKCCLDEVVLYLRVSGVFEDVEVVVSCGEDVIFSKRERVLRPPEMVKIVLDKELLGKCVGEVSVEVRPRG